MQQTVQWNQVAWLEGCLVPFFILLGNFAASHEFFPQPTQLTSLFSYISSHGSLAVMCLTCCFLQVLFLPLRVIFQNTREIFLPSSVPQAERIS